ncbi:hypothetical protein D3C87_1810820 [compost metagenome]
MLVSLSKDEVHHLRHLLCQRYVLWASGIRLETDRLALSVENTANSANGQVNGTLHDVANVLGATNNLVIAGKCFAHVLAK